jgi:hypothetical protein
MQAAAQFLNLSLTEWESIAKIVGFFSAAAFFIYKAVSGYLITNLSVKLKCNREHSNITGMDYLIVTAALAKGERGSVSIHDGQARLRYDGGTTQPTPLIGMERLSYQTVKLKNQEMKQIDWDKRSESSPFIRLSPGEKAEFACYWEVPSNSVCRVEVVFVGSRLKSWKLGQWRSSLVSIPVPEKLKP